MNFYALLGIPRDADDKMIRGAYRILARRYHPDRGAGSSTEKFRQINQAYETLIHPGSRHAYDRSLQPVELPAPTLRAEPMVRASGPFRPEDSDVFGRLGCDQYGPARHVSYSLDDFLDTWLDSLDELFFGPEWPS